MAADRKAGRCRGRHGNFGGCEAGEGLWNPVDLECPGAFRAVQEHEHLAYSDAVRGLVSANTESDRHQNHAAGGGHTRHV